ncbi:mannose-binding protein [Streptomyces sp. NPDC003642]
MQETGVEETAPAATSEAPSGAAAVGKPTATTAEPSSAPSASSTPEASTAPAPSAPGGETSTTPETSTAPETSKSPDAAAASDVSATRIGLAAAVAATPPGVTSATGVDRGRPRKPVLAGAAVVGAVLIAVPLLLAGGGNDDDGPDASRTVAAEDVDTVLGQESAPAALDDYVAEKPSASPSKKKPSKSAAPVAAPPPVAPAPQPSSSPTKTAKPKPKPKPKPKETPRPNWSTETVYAVSVLEVNQAWTTNRIRMVMQTDGNLVVYNEKGKPIWASMTFGQNHRAIFQGDGNLVIHNAADRPIWASKSHGHDGAQLVLRADAKVVIVHNGQIVWST